MGNVKAFIIFITVVLLVYGSANYILFRRITQSLSLTGNAALFLKGILLFLILAYPVGRIAANVNILGPTLIWIGSLWLGVMVYGLLTGLSIDLLRLGDLAFGWFPEWVNNNRVIAGRMIFASCATIIVIMLTAGLIRAMYPVIREITVESERFPPGRDEYHIAFFSDAHLGVIVGRKKLAGIVERINEIGADLCLIGGDLVDETPSRIDWAVDILKRIDCPDGVWAVTGNHEFYAGVETCTKMMERAGINLLRDNTAIIAGKVALIGLDDQTGGSQFGGRLTPISKLVDSVDGKLPVILLHHSPTRMKEAADAGVDLMIAGHTHGGQMLPFGILTNAIFKVKSGLSHFGKMNFFLSVGVGTWGPPIRLGTPPEVVHIILKSNST